MRKKRILRTLLIVSGIVLLALMTGAYLGDRSAPRKPASIPRGDYSYTIQYAEYRVRQLMSQHHLPSLGVALIDDQDVVWKEAFGLADVETELPAETDTIYKMWSLSKVFTAIEVMRLVEDGLLDLDAPITDYLPEFSIQSRFPDSEPITIRSILAHQSGLPRNECRWVEFRPAVGEVLAELAASLEDCHVAFPVGYRYHYSNIGPDILGYLVQMLRGEDFPRYMRQDLLAPIGMGNSAFVSSDLAPGSDLALGYEYYKGETYPLEQRDITSLPSGNLYSTLDDMSEFVRFIFRGEETNGQQIIAPETLSLMFEEQYGGQADHQPMGLGWKIATVLGGERLVWHDGGPADGIGSLVAMLPEKKLGIVLFANEISFEGPVSVGLALEILELMLETRYGMLSLEEVAPEPIEVERSDLERYVGRYIAFGEVIAVGLRGDRLQVNFHGLKLDLIPVGLSTFRIDHWLLRLGMADILPLPLDLEELEIRFFKEGDAGGDVMITTYGGFLTEVCPRYPDLDAIPLLWEEIAGDYELVRRLPSGLIGSEVVGQTMIVVEEGVLRMIGTAGPLLPISETEIIFLSGPFAGETMAYEPATGYLYHQSFAFKPVSPAADG